jgi:hypothetical protein
MCTPTLYLKYFDWKAKYLKAEKKVKLRTSPPLLNMDGMNGLNNVTPLQVFQSPRYNWEGIWVLQYSLSLSCRTNIESKWPSSIPDIRQVPHT